jgi:peptide/nickel transport system substrate-binding protein
MRQHLVLLITGLIFSLVLNISPASVQGVNRIVYGLTLSVSGIDPHINQSSELGIVLRQVYDTLTYRSPGDNAIVPGLASSWEINEDGTQYTFRLRDDVVFHDGTPFNAQAVAANIDRILDPALGSQKARPLLGPMIGYEVVDDFTISFVLSQPYSPLLDALSQVYLGIASPAALERYASDPVLYQFHQIGTGPFIFVEYLPEDRIVLRRNPAYQWGPDFYANMPVGNIDEIEFRYFTDPATRAISLLNGDAHIMGEILPSEARRLSGSSEIQLMPVAIPGQPTQFYFNTQLPPTNRTEFRQALIHATNRSAIVEAVYQGFSPVAWGPLTAATLYYAPSVFGAYNYDVVQAEQLLTSIGAVDTDGDGVREYEGAPIRLRLIQPPWGLVPQVVQLMRDQWRIVGIDVEILAVPGFTSLVELVNSGDFHLVEFETSGLDPAFLSTRYISGQPANWTGFSNEQLDALLQNATISNELAQRASLYEQAQILIMQQALILPIRDIVNINAYVSGIEGLIFDSYGWFPLLYGLSYNPPA